MPGVRVFGPTGSEICQCLRSAALAGDGKGSDPHKTLRATGQYMGLGMTWALSVLLFLGVGGWLDSRLGTTPILMILGVFVGAGAGFYSLYYHIVIEPREGGHEPK